MCPVPVFSSALVQEHFCCWDDGFVYDHHAMLGVLHSAMCTKQARSNFRDSSGLLWGAFCCTTIVIEFSPWEIILDTFSCAARHAD